MLKRINHHIFNCRTDWSDNWSDRVSHYNLESSQDGKGGNTKESEKKREHNKARDENGLHWPGSPRFPSLSETNVSLKFDETNSEATRAEKTAESH